MIRYLTFLTLLVGLWPRLCTAQRNSINLSPQSSLKTMGYFRTSLAESLGGETMAEFIVPGASATYRLGNEPNTFSEVGLAYNYKFDNADSSSLDAVATLTGFAPFGTGQAFKYNNLGQAYVRANNIFGEADVWVGKRFYNRSDFHILNYVWYNVAQEARFGAGIEDIAVLAHKARLALALLTFENKGVASLNQPINGEIAPKVDLNSYMIDLRLTDIHSNYNGTVNLWLRAASRAGKAAFNLDNTKGYGLGIWHEQKNIAQGRASNHIQTSIRTGITVNQYQYSGTPVYETYGNSDMRSYDMKKNYTFEISDNFQYEKEKDFAFNFLALYRLDNRGIEPYNRITGEKHSVGETIHWFTTGVRYIKFLHKHINLAVELGNDYIDNKTINRQGWMQKLTFTPQISWNYGFYSRPVLRPFVTYATWSNSLKGVIGNTPDAAPFADKTNGLTYGLSFEFWW